uniref:Triosephosphate isomerase n=1 Tax=Lotharella globosa TaxID=91324 RepID=A0A7S3Z867_9EUKA|mmetsp:Transcript_38745/g.74416  ORF Transcript_38745/g.74416 Transcript_38745/m.74416 type:complete len:259 (+) Transcript_38745:72-848(+)
MPRKTLVIGNWKCNGKMDFVDSLTKGITAGLAKTDTKNVDVLVAPTMMHLPMVVALTKGTKLAVCAQNVSANPCGAFTGEVSAEQLKDAGIGWTIIGHSERRQSEKMQTFESNKLVALKVEAAQSNGLSVCVCVGETEAERKEGRTFAVIEEQLKAVLPAVKGWGGFALAYEPLWAIGTGNTASAQQAQDVHDHIRKFVSNTVSAEVGAALRICYGGSVKPKNSAELISQKDIDGFLVGGASLKSETFLPIIASVVSK